MLEVAGVVKSSAVDGPGNRYVLFLQGCNFDCFACHNPSTIGRCEPAAPVSAAPRGTVVPRVWSTAPPHVIAAGPAWRCALSTPIPPSASPRSARSLRRSGRWRGFSASPSPVVSQPSRPRRWPPCSSPSRPIPSWAAHHPGRHQRHPAGRPLVAAASECSTGRWSISRQPRPSSTGTSPDDNDQVKETIRFLSSVGKLAEVRLSSWRVTDTAAELEAWAGFVGGVDRGVPVTAHGLPPHRHPAGGTAVAGDVARDAAASA